MRRAIRKSVQLFCYSFDVSGPVVEIGSYYMPGFKQICDLRSLFPGLEYVGCDIRQGLGVDRIEDAHSLRFGDGAVGTLILLEILEHLPAPHLAISEAHRVLSNNGLLVVSVPFNMRLHGFPCDYWRFTASGIYTMLSGFQAKVVFALGPRLKPALIFAVAAKFASTPFAQGQAAFERRIRRNFKESWPRVHINVFKERTKAFFGLLLGRADLSVNFFDGSQDGGYCMEDRDEQGTPTGAVHRASVAPFSE